jgi:hypothetical protein
MSYRVENNRNQSVVVPFDVEDHAVAVHIRMAKRVAHVREIPPVGAARHLVLSIKGASASGCFRQDARSRLLLMILTGAFQYK